MFEDDYAELQFVERNADHRTNQTVHGRRPSRTFVPSRPFGGSGYRTPAHQQMMYAQPGLGVGIGGGNLLGGMTTGQLIDMVGQIFAALMPLPGAPTATADAATDVGNLILYQGSLAQYAKRDEQIRTLGNLVMKLVG